MGLEVGRGWAASGFQCYPLCLTENLPKTIDTICSHRGEVDMTTEGGLRKVKDLGQARNSSGFSLAEGGQARHRIQGPGPGVTV